MKKEMKLLLPLFLVLCYAGIAQAQTLVFEDGLYLNGESLKNNTPDYTLYEVTIKEGSNKKRPTWDKLVDPIGSSGNYYMNSVIVKEITRKGEKGKKGKIPIESVVAIAVDNSIYFRIKDVFTQAYKTASICLITEEQIKTNNFLSAPGGVPGTLNMSKFKSAIYLYKMGTEALVEFNEENLKTLISDDKDLLEHFEGNDDSSNQLMAYLEKYNERHPLQTK